MIVRPLFALVTSLALLAASPAPKPPPLKLQPAPKNAQTALVKRYVDAQKAGKYADAFALLEPGGQKYFRNADDYASIFTSANFSISSYSITGVAGGSNAFRLYFVSEKVSFRDPTHDALLVATISAPLGVVGSGAGARIKDINKPWKAFASKATATVSGLRVDVRKVAYYDTYMSVIVLISNLGDGYVTLLPYGRTVLRDEAGTVYPLIALKNWAVTDKNLYLGVRLAPDAQYSGAFSFTIPKPDDAKHTYTLTMAPSVRDGGEEPISIDVPNITPGG